MILFRDKHGFIFVWNMESSESYTQLQSWEEQIKYHSNVRDIAVVVFANKSDIVTSVPPVYAQCVTKYNSSNISCFKTSAKTGDGIKEGFNELLMQLMKNVRHCNQLESHLNKLESQSGENNPSFISPTQNCCLH